MVHAHGPRRDLGVLRDLVRDDPDIEGRLLSSAESPPEDGTDCHADTGVRVPAEDLEENLLALSATPADRRDDKVAVDDPLL